VHSNGGGTLPACVTKTDHLLTHSLAVPPTAETNEAERSFSVDQLTLPPEGLTQIKFIKRMYICIDTLQHQPNRALSIIKAQGTNLHQTTCAQRIHDGSMVDAKSKTTPFCLSAMLHVPAW
jgi:uncharacterized protein YqcC (DUF446 family)